MNKYPYLQKMGRTVKLKKNTCLHQTSKTEVILMCISNHQLMLWFGMLLFDVLFQRMEQERHQAVE